MRSTLTCNGVVPVRRRRYQSLNGSICTSVTDLINRAGCGAWLAVRELECRIAINSGPFARASANLWRLAQLKLSDHTPRQLSESKARAVIAWQGQLALDFDAGSWRTTQTSDSSPRSRACIGERDRHAMEAEECPRAENTDPLAPDLSCEPATGIPVLPPESFADPRFGILDPVVEKTPVGCLNHLERV
ncbi:hypothetical protein [Fontivita pretiosa]|uniref:hypothetical protein n=1 Tax=Fontivita pretiosa TaxID=2989684 RepID=UPI003D17A980